MRVSSTPQGIFTMEEGLSQAWLKSLSDDDFRKQINRLETLGDVDEAAKLRAMRPALNN